MIDYCVEVVRKAVTYLGTVFSHECVERVKLLKSTSFVFVNEPPEPYSVTKNLVILDRDLLIGEKVFKIIYIIIIISIIISILIFTHHSPIFQNSTCIVSDS